MKRNALLTCVLAVLSLMATNCEADVNNKPPENEIVVPPRMMKCSDFDNDKPLVVGENTLAGTSWKLMGFCDVEKDEFTEPDYGEYKDCDYCYTLILTDTSANWYDGLLCYGMLVHFDFGGGYVTDYAHSTITFDVGKVAYSDILDGEKYYDAFNRVTIFELKDAELKLYYNSKKNSLLFKRRQK